MSEIKERPILFSAPMVRAILEGRKTVTRRVCKPQPSPNAHTTSAEGSPMTSWWETGKDIVRCPYGQPGERLWVRETWGVISHDFDEQGNMIDWSPDRPASLIREMRFGRGYYSGHVIYRADGEAVWAGDDDGGGDDRSAWKPSIHMPRIASRILLEITDVRVERLQAITYEEAVAEGVHRDRACRMWTATDEGGACHKYPVPAFRDLWSGINGAENWNANPWVWVVEFKRVTP
ncbi:hypothetical protein L6218_06280 [Pseudomonas syringae pv. syringae]|uniref:hypothetical protein n=1 Tax=Pseudomonas TaxID=286 RepID=UPI000C12CDCF|nr:hypothetical protein [Pseudomonas syringae]MCF5551933.1 hypothetical protein [Pseudomonas syringae]MCH5497997.1 hypothetical protein [Pseudomonas syringae pv. syringae]MCH5523987.1 hypothetical protein [Pseudomonas syringae pv. syringae]MCH5559077.1 hypothetical protein [Pseudomonas syringae pv. syringae]MCH5564127.1 hypothetical protein [Pseudomonas syringae pv. syringae]